MTMLLNLLPELFEQIIGYIPIYDLKNLSQSCSTCNKALKEHLWRNIRITYAQLVNEDFDDILDCLKYTRVLHFVGKYHYDITDNHDSMEEKASINYNKILNYCHLEVLYSSFILKDTFENTRNLKKLIKLDLRNTDDNDDETDGPHNGLDDSNLGIICNGLNQLKILNISGSCDVTDIGLVHLNKLLTLEELDLSYCYITGNGLVHINNLVNLKALNVSGCRERMAQVLEESIGISLCNNLQLTQLHLSGCGITDQTVSRITSFTLLKQLDISYNPITDEGLRHLTNLQHLYVLDVSANSKIRDLGIRFLVPLSSLKNLKLGYTGVSDSVIPYLFHFQELCDLDMSFCSNITWENICVDNLSLLKNMNLWHCNVTNDALGCISVIQSLCSLNIRWNNSVTEKGLKHLSNLRNLKKLYISYCSDVGVSYIAALTLLTTLHLDRANITDVSISHLLQLHNLSELDVNDCKGLTGKSISQLSSLKALTTLSLINCGLTDGTISYIGDILSLECLNLQGNQFTGKGLKGLSGLKRLREINISSNSHVKDLGMPYLSMLVSLRVIYASSYEVSEAGLSQLRELMKGTIISYVD